MLFALLAVLNAECRIACLTQYDTGEYRSGKCACIRLVDYELATQKVKPKALPTHVDQAYDRDRHGDEYE